MGCGSSVNGRRYAVGLPAASEDAVANLDAASGVGPSPTSASSRRKPAALPLTRWAPFADAPLADLGDYEVLQVLDRTEFSTVACLKHRRTGQLAAGKRVGRHQWAGARQACENEVRLLRELAESCLVPPLLGACEDASEVCIVLRLCGGGHLENWLRRHPKSARDAARQLLEAVQGLHSRLICHLDLAPANVLFDDGGGVRLCDFATARRLISSTELLTADCGTPGFKAPEVGHGPYSGLGADVFSLGRTLQVAAKAEPAWREAGAILGAMTSQDAARRPALAAAHAELFGGRKKGLAVSKAEKTLYELDRALSFEPWAEGENLAVGLAPKKAAPQRGPARPGMPPPPGMGGPSRSMFAPL